MNIDELQGLTERARSVEDVLRSEYPEHAPLIKLELSTTGLEIHVGAWSNSASYVKTVVVTWCQIHGGRVNIPQQIQFTADMMRVCLRKDRRLHG